MARTTIPSVAFFSPRAISTALRSSNAFLTTTIFVNNLHCSSCVTHVNDTIGQLHGIFKVEVNLLNHTIFVQHSSGVTSDFISALTDAGFEIDHIATSDEQGRVVRSRSSPSRKEWFQYLNPSIFMSRTRKNHIANCGDCQSRGFGKSIWQRLYGQKTVDIESSIAKDENEESSPNPDRYVATISVSGITCSSCVSTITAGLKSMSYIEDVEVNLLTYNAMVVYRGTASDAQKVIDVVEDCGYGGSLVKVEPIQTSSLKAIFSIVGMTCGSCVATVTDGLKEVEGVQSVNVSLVGNSATLSIVDEQVIAKVQEAVDDMGFECSVAQLQAEASDQTKRRTVEFEITGMYCALCPRNIVRALTDTFESDVEIIVPPTVEQARIKVRYFPQSPSINIRKIRSAIELVDPQISVVVFHPPSMEELSQAVQRKEFFKIARHFLLTLIAAIPTFVIGVVYMTLVSEHNTTRIWFEEPIWLGSVMRMDWAMLLVTIPVMFYGAGIFHLRAIKEVVALWRPGSKTPIPRRFYRFGSMNLLISAGCSVAFFGSLCVLILEATTPREKDPMKKRQSITYFDTVTFLTLFILVGKGLQAWSKAKTGDVVAELAKLRPTTAYLATSTYRSGKQGPVETKEIAADLIEIGDVVSIARGASPPADGEVNQEGIFFFDESSLTGESKPVKKTRGDTIHTGSVNVSDPVRMVVKELGGKSTLDQIIAAVRTGQTKSAPVERFAEKWTSYFAPIITLIAISTWVTWVGLGVSGVLPRHWLDVEQGGWPFWSLEFAIAVFVVACPCGLGLAAPTALFVGGGLAAKKGILVQGGGEAFQEASQLDVVVFDKTGTLTEGQMRVTELRFADEETRHHDARLVIAMAKTLEEASGHPIAKAIATYCAESTLTTSEVSALEISEEPGQGMRGVFQVSEAGSSVRWEASLGNEQQLQTLRHAGLNIFLSSMLQRFQSTGCSTSIFSVRRIAEADAKDASWRSVAVFAITDPIRAEALSVLNTLRMQKIDVHMCTGDNSTTAQAIASQLDIPVSNIRAGATPQDKAAYIQQLQVSSSTAERRTVAFVGDGTNDTPALTAADVSIALSSGSDIAMTSSSFILLNSNLETILDLVRIAKRVFTRVKLNFAWAAVYNIALIPVAAGLFFPIAQWRLSPVWAAAAMAMSSLSVVLSSLALRLPEIRLGGASRLR